MLGVLTYISYASSPSLYLRVLPRALHDVYSSHGDSTLRLLCNAIHLRTPQSSRIGELYRLRGAQLRDNF